MLTNALRKKYELIISSEQALVNNLIDKIASSISVKANTAEEIIESCFSEKGMSLKLLSALKSINTRKKIPTFSYKHKDLFNSQAKSFFGNVDIKRDIANYTRQYKSLIRKSVLFTSGVFDISNLSKISVILKDNKYFEGNNKLLLNGYSEPISNFEQLEKLIANELSKIDKNPSVVKSFRTIMEKNVGSNQQVSKIFEYLKTDIELAKEYRDYAKLEKTYLLSKLNKLSTELNNLKKEHKKNKSSITKIFRVAEKTKTIWEKVIPEFKKRFRTRFDIKIVNRTNHIFGFEEPEIEFTFDTIKAEEAKLRSDVFSTGENRAYHMLQTLLEIELIKEEGKDTIVLFDDIADSYDYSNKLVILQYIEEIAKNDNIYIILLTHNFDFYRSVGLRIASHSNSFFANKSSVGVTIQNGKYLKNVFSEFMNSIGTSMKGTIAIVPFARNLKEYSDTDYKNDDCYQLYTKLIHYRPHGTNIKLSTLISSLRKQFGGTFPFFSLNPTVYSCIDSEAKIIAGQATIDQTLEDKMIITIALRIRCEKYLYKQILKVDSTIKTRIEDMVMGDLFEEFKNLYPNKSKNKDLINSVCLLVPPHIHVNNFMYEPMIDYSIDRFRQLYNDVIAVFK